MTIEGNQLFIAYIANVVHVRKFLLRFAVEYFCICTTGNDELRVWHLFGRLQNEFEVFRGILAAYGKNVIFRYSGKDPLIWLDMLQMFRAIISHMNFLFRNTEILMKFIP